MKIRKIKQKVWVLLVLCFAMILLPQTAFGAETEEYHPDDVAIVNKMIANNDLSAPEDEPAQWKFATWSSEKPKRIIGLSIDKMGLTGTLDVGEVTNLTFLTCANNQLTALNVSGLTSLEILNCYHNKLTTLNVGGLTNLTELYCDTNKLTTLNVGGLTNLTHLNCSDNKLTELDVSGLTSLEILNCYNNQLTMLNVGGLTNLNYLYCNNNQLTALNVSGLTKLSSLDCYENQLTEFTDRDGNQLTVTKKGPGNALITNYDISESEVTLTAAPFAPYRFVYWEGLPEKTGNNSFSASFVLEDSQNVKAVFQMELTADMVADIPEQTYTGQAITPDPEVSVKIGEETVVFENGTDFTGSYENNIDVGTATVTVTPKEGGQLTGEAVTKSFTIKEPGPVSIYYALHFETNGGNEIQSRVEKSGTTIDLAEYIPVRDGYTFTGWYADEDLTEKITEVKLDQTRMIYAGWEKDGPVVDPKKDQAIYMTVAAQERDLKNGSRTTKSKVCMLKLGFAVEDPDLDLTYTTSDPEVATVEDGKITYQGVGSCVITVTAKETALCKAASRDIEVVVGKLGTPTFTPTVTANTAKKAFVVTSSTVRGVDGWEVQYSIRDDWWKATTKDFPDTGTKLYRKTCTTVHSNMTYYIRVRGYQIIEGEKVYSDWSPAKTIQTK